MCFSCERFYSGQKTVPPRVLASVSNKAAKPKASVSLNVQLYEALCNVRQDNSQHHKSTLCGYTESNHAIYMTCREDILARVEYCILRSTHTVPIRLVSVAWAIFTNWGLVSSLHCSSGIC